MGADEIFTQSLQARTVVPAAAVFNAQIRSYANEAKASPTEVSSILEQRIRGVAEEASLAETGRVLSIGYVMSALDLPAQDPDYIIYNSVTDIRSLQRRYCPCSRLAKCPG